MHPVVRATILVNTQQKVSEVSGVHVVWALWLRVRVAGRFGVCRSYRRLAAVVKTDFGFCLTVAP